MRAIRKPLFSLFVAFGLLVSCRASNPGSAALQVREDGEIIGGKVAIGLASDGVFNAVGSMRIERELTTKLLDADDVQSSRENCTGVLIERDLMLTAAHCVVDETLLWAVPDGRLRVHGQVDFPLARQSVAIAKALFHSEFAAIEPARLGASRSVMVRNDLALVLLSEPLREPIVPARLIQQNLQNLQVLDVRIYGFGLSEQPHLSVPTNSKVLRFVETQGTFVKSPQKILYNQTNGKGVCYGDSGGPHFIQENSRWVLAGISSALHAIAGDRGELCQTGASATALGEFKTWISKATKALRNPKQLSGAF